jgi:hypothetical protein
MTACLPTAFALAALLALAGCGAVGDLDTAAMQTTNRAVGAPLNGPGDPPSPHR